MSHAPTETHSPTSFVADARVDIGRHALARNGRRHFLLHWRGDVSEAEMVRILEVLDSWDESQRFLVLTNEVSELGRFSPEARRRMAGYRFSNEKAEENLLQVVGANIVQRAVMTLVITAAKLTTPARLSSDYIDELDTALTRARAYLEARPEAG